MAVHSKQHRFTLLNRITCKQLVHPWTDSCALCGLDMAAASARGTFLFLGAMHLVQLASKGRGVTRAQVRSHLASLLQSVVFGSVLCSSVTVTSCLFRAVFGRYSYHTFVLLPGLVTAGVAVFLERPANRRLFGFTLVQMCLEYYLQVLLSEGVIKLSKRTETVLFMIFNALMMHLMKTDTSRTPVYWFFKPTPSKDDSEKPECDHQGPCWKFVATAAGKYAFAGLGLQLLRLGLSMSPRAAASRFLSRASTLRLAAFLAGYVAALTGGSCLLRAPHLRTWLPGLAAGAAYWLNPNRTVASCVATNAMQLLVKRGVDKGVLPSLPLATEMMFTLACGLLFHARYSDGERYPNFMRNMLKAISSGRVDYIYEHMTKIADQLLTVVN